VRIEVLQIPFLGGTYDLGSLGCVITIFWLVALTNLINLADGIDGLAGGVSAMLMCLLVYTGWGAGLVFPTLCAAAMWGALVAFLRYNFPPARIYMGDGGAYFLGYLIAILALVHSQKGTVLAALIAPALALALPIADTALAIVRRGLRGLPIFRPDRKHIHHRLMAKGLSRQRVVLTLYAVSVVFLLGAFAVYWQQGQWLALLLGCVCLVLLLSGKIFDFGREWMNVIGVLDQTGETRRESRYALALADWLGLEAERAGSVEDLWVDFQYLLQKVGFARATLVLGDGQREWESADGPPGDPDLAGSYEVNGGGAATLQIAAWSNRMSPATFEQVSEIAAEYWHKVAVRWHERSQLPLRFDSRLATGERISGTTPSAPAQAADRVGQSNPEVT
jgi:UDP-GlcNAc:undecaprenyl-phosphate GlcNAc-1-phosphate transferase